VAALATAIGLAVNAAPAAAAPVGVACGNGVCIWTVNAGVGGLTLQTGRGGPSVDTAVLVLPEIDPLIGPGITGFSAAVHRTTNLNQFTVAFIGQDGGVFQNINAATGSGTLKLRGTYERFNFINGEDVGALLLVDHSTQLAFGGACAEDVVVFACADAFGSFTPTQYSAGVEADPPIGAPINVTIIYQKGKPISVTTNPPLV
jgi:hypothetical protein